MARTVGVVFGLSILFTIICDIVLTEPRSTSCETYQHSTNVKEHKTKVTHSTYSFNSILRRSLQKQHVRSYQDSSIL